nr:HEPN family nuclease [uncultured Anaerobutyricum sp.]
MNLTKQESIFCQALAMTSLLEELSNRDFLNSDYYNENITFVENNDNFKKILKASGLGNPATMQMFLYILLVMPKETLSGLDDRIINLWGDNLKETLQSYSSLSVTTTYPGESSSELSTIDYYRHIRNAVSHARCVYETENGRTYVTFKDKNRDSQNQYHCEIKMLTSDVGSMLEALQNQMMAYLNRHWSI